MPTRYALELDSLKGSVTDETLREDSQKLDAKKNIKKVR
jgi:large subunit ribosomal protein L27e